MPAQPIDEGDSLRDSFAARGGIAPTGVSDIGATTGGLPLQENETALQLNVDLILVIDCHYLASS
ncbi:MULTISPECIES: hypothetical protein [unclassified Microcoleus]|uniref:hypothetical protein n=1 Tax=unclassified Microcoleus TaxID=2642155 RepID=UPI002FD0A6FA